MKPREFVATLLADSRSEAPLYTLKRILAKRVTCRPEHGAAHHDGWHYRDYYLYNPVEHMILCCGWTDWWDHRDSYS
jgi:hypothetical protein